MTTSEFIRKREYQIQELEKIITTTDNVISKSLIELEIRNLKALVELAKIKNQ